MADFNYESRHENCGFYFQDDHWFWEETYGPDDENDPWTLFVLDNIRAHDFVFLVACGIAPEDL